MTVAFGWGSASLYNLRGIHPDLRALCDRALVISVLDFRIIDGLRTLKEQAMHVRRGASKTMNSRHLTGHAIDFTALDGWEIDWYDLEKYKVIGAAFKKAEVQLKVSMDWGGDWKWKDWGHIQLSWDKYPK